MRIHCIDGIYIYFHVNVIYCVRSFRIYERLNILLRNPNRTLLRMIQISFKGMQMNTTSQLLNWNAMVSSTAGCTNILNCHRKSSLAFRIRTLLPSLIQFLDCAMKQWLSNLLVHNVVLFTEPDT